MKILFAAAELTPLVKVGGLGDVIGALPKALQKEKVDVSVIIPRYTFIDKNELELVAKDIAVPLAEKTEKISLYKGKMPHASVPVFFVDNPTYLSTGPAPYFEQTGFVGAKEEVERFVFFSRAVHVLLAEKVIKTDIVHAHDWHVGALVSLLKKDAQKFKTIFTIHNLGNQGIWNADEIDKTFAPFSAESFTRSGDAYNFIAEGITQADWVTTVSNTYAKEILTKNYGNGLDKILLSRQDTLSGIVNGIDNEFFNPETDTKIFENFSYKTLDRKKQNREVLFQAVGLPNDDAPLFGFVSRLTDQKGIDILIKALAMFADKHDARFVFLGSGTTQYENALLEFQRKYPQKISVRIGFDEMMAHRIYAGADFFLMPSRFEPCGLGQMIAMRYGALPIVRATGGLKDTVSDMETGFVFEKSIDLSLDKAMRIAYDIYTNNHKRFVAMQKNAMKRDFSFSKSAKEYKRLYTRVLKK